MAIPLPPPTVGTGALYVPQQSSSGDLRHHPQPRASPIAHFSSLPNDGIGNEALVKSGGQGNGGIPTSGRLLAVNSRYVAYAVKKGLVRVIDRRSASRALLRGHDDGTRMVDAAFFGESGAKEGVGGLWEELAEFKNRQSGGGASGIVDGGGEKAPLPPAAASDVLATLGGAGDRASILIWRLHSSNNNNGNGSLGADKLLEVRFGHASRLVWHPFNPNRFLLLHRNMQDGEKKAGSESAGGRTVATLVETTRLLTRPHETEGHMVCDCEEREPGGAVGMVPGMIPLTVTDEDVAEGDDLAVAGANDVTWSSRDARHVLTAHDDGMVRLWDLTSTRPVAAGGAGVEGGVPAELPSYSIPCLAQLDVTSAESSSRERRSRWVTRVLFLSQYEDPAKNGGNAVTPPFITGTDMNRTITLWSSFSASSLSKLCLPKRLRTFGMNDDHSLTSYFPMASMILVELIPAPYRPEPSASDPSALPSMDASAADVSAWIAAGNATKSSALEATVPSSFLLLAERNSATMHALHLDTEWKETNHGVDDDDDEGGALSSRAVAVRGFDYVTTLNVVHPVYSCAIAPTSADEAANNSGMGGDALKEERDVDLCCIQSKAVQMLTLSAEMLAPPEDDGREVAPGVSLLDSPAELASEDEIEEEGAELDEEEAEEEEEEEFGEEEFEEEYDMEEDGLMGDVEYSTNDGRNDEDDDDDDGEVAIPTATESEPNAFSNWLGAIANPLPPPAAAEKPKASPPPGLGFPSILPPPPGMAPAPAPPLAAGSMTFLSPMQILSGSSSDLEPPKKEEPTKPTSAVSMSVKGPVPGPPPGMPAASNKAAAKKQAKKNRSQDRGGRALSPKQPVVVGPMKILQRAEEPQKEEEARSSILPPHPAPSHTDTTATAAADAVVSAPGGAEDGAVSSQAPSAVDLAAIETTVENAISAHMKSHEADLLASIRRAIASEVSSKVGLAVGNAVRASFKDADNQDRKANDSRQAKAIEAAVRQGVGAGLANGLASGVEDGMDRALGKALAGGNMEGKGQGRMAKALERHAKESAERAAKEAVAGMQPAIMDSLHQTMREFMIPAYESATRQMFQQTSTTLEQGLAQMSLSQANSAANASSSMAPMFEAMSAQMIKMSQAIHSLNAEVAQLRGAVNDIGARNQGADVQPPGGAPGAPPAPLGIRDEIVALCTSRRYEEAFTKAVSASDGDVVLFACENSDVGEVFGNNGEGVVTISQPILICLMQQLGAVLVSKEGAGDVRKILSWLQEIAVTIDPTNVNIQRHVGSVVQQLLSNINSKMLNCDPAFRRPLQTLMQVIRGLL